MAFIINCGEQDIENEGICISLQIHGEKEDTPDTVFINILDNLLGISEFISNSGYNFAQVGIDYDRKGLDCKEYLSFTDYINKEGNERLKELLNKYVSYEEDEAVVEDGVIWYYFLLDDIKAEMSDDDAAEFTKIFKGTINS